MTHNIHICWQVFGGLLHGTHSAWTMYATSVCLIEKQPKVIVFHTHNEILSILLPKLIIKMLYFVKTSYIFDMHHFNCNYHPNPGLRLYFEYHEQCRKTAIIWSLGKEMSATCEEYFCGCKYTIQINLLHSVISRIKIWSFVKP